MTQEELQKIIDQLEEKVLEDNATFGIFQYGGDSDESFIRADKEGLKLFALELLKAAAKANEIITDKEKSIIPITFEENWIDEQSDTVIQYIEPVDQRLIGKEEKKYEKTIADKLFPYGCFAGLIIIIGAIIVGLVTMITWIF